MKPDEIDRAFEAWWAEQEAMRPPLRDRSSKAIFRAGAAWALGEAAKVCANKVERIGCRHDGVILDSNPPYCGTCGAQL